MRSFFKNPIIFFLCIVLFFRSIGLFVYFVVQSQGSWVERLLSFSWAVLDHAAVLLFIYGVFLLLCKIFPFSRRYLSFFVGLASLVFMALGQATLVLSHISGQELSLSALKTYLGPKLFFSDIVVNTMIQHSASIGTFAIILSILIILMFVYWKRNKYFNLDSMGWGTLIFMTLGPSLLKESILSTGFVGTPRPSEVIIIQDLLRLDQTDLQTSESEAIQEIRNFVGLPEGAEWKSNEYPLVYHPPMASAQKIEGELPDIVMVVIESWRAAEFNFMGNSAQPIKMKNTRQLATKSILFQNYLSSGFPSEPSVIALNTSSWPHIRKQLSASYEEVSMDNLPTRLARQGYSTNYISGNPNFERLIDFVGRWYEQRFSVLGENLDNTDENIINIALREIRQHDQRNNPPPLFIAVHTVSSHYPFDLPAKDKEDYRPKSSSLHDKYQSISEYTDFHLGRLYTLLEKRRKKDNTVLIMVGDHSFVTDLKKKSGLPTNDTIWVPALIHGPERLLGKPRRDYQSASHVDIFPTLMAIVGDSGPTAALGRNLLQDNRINQAVSIRIGGSRLDQQGRSLIVDIRSPLNSHSQTLFPQWAWRPLFDPKKSVKNDGQTLLRVTKTWSHLIENNRVWNPLYLQP